MSVESKCRGLDCPVSSVGGAIRKVLALTPTSESPTRSGPAVLIASGFFFVRFVSKFLFKTGFCRFSALAVFGIVDAPSGMG